MCYYPVELCRENIYINVILYYIVVILVNSVLRGDTFDKFYLHFNVLFFVFFFGQGLLDGGEAQTAAELSCGASFLPGTRCPVRRSRFPAWSQMSVQEQAANRSTNRVDATSREYCCFEYYHIKIRLSLMLRTSAST